jgi:hypothetical protein
MKQNTIFPKLIQKLIFDDDQLYPRNRHASGYCGNEYDGPMGEQLNDPCFVVSDRAYFKINRLDQFLVGK